MEVFYRSIRLQNRFLEDLRQIDRDRINELVDFFAKYLTDDIPHRSIHVLSKGRSALSTFSFLQGLYDTTFKISKRSGKFRFDPATLRDGVIKYLGSSSLALAVSGSGETTEVVRYLEDAVKCKSRTVLITASKDSTAFEVMKKAGGFVFLMESKREGSKVDEGQKMLSPLGSEFEFKAWILLNSLIPEIESRLLGNYDESCPEYENRFNLFLDNIKLLETDWIEEEALTNWIDRLTNRHGLLVFYGITKSGHVAEQFEMRFAHLNKKVFMLDDSNRKPFRYGDALVVISGGGNTEDVNEAAIEALGLEVENGELRYKTPRKRIADVFGITANKNSRLRKILEFAGQEENLLILPIIEGYREGFLKTMPQTVMRPSDFGRWRIPIFETSAYVIANAIVAQIAENEGILPQFLKEQHV